MTDFLRIIHAQTAFNPSAPAVAPLSPEAPFTPQPAGTSQAVYRPIGPDNPTNVATIPGIYIDDLEDGTRRGVDGQHVALGKGPVYVPWESAPGVPGYIDVVKDSKLLMSAAEGKIKQMVDEGLVTTVSLTDADLVAPAITPPTQFGVPGAGDVTITGTGFLSVAPAVSRVIFTGPGAQIVILDAAFLGVPGAVHTDVSIVIPAAALVPGLVGGGAGSFAEVEADGLLSGPDPLI